MTIKDVAEAAGVSISTVSRYFNNGYVSDENKAKIKNAIESTGYQVNVFARGLKTNKSKLIAIIIPRLDSFTAIQSLKGMNSVLSKLGYQMVVVPKNTIEEDEIGSIRRIAGQGFDGIIVMAHAITDEHVLLAKSSRTPILFTGQSHPQIDSITLDDYKIGFLAGQYVNELDVDNILYLSVSESDCAVGVNRKKGFLDSINKSVRTLISGFSQEEAYHIMDRESSTIKFDIIVGATDNISIGALKYLQENNILVPDDVKIMGIGNYDLSQFIHPTLTTLNIDYQAFGQNAAHKMMSYLVPDYTFESQDIELSIIQRSSTQ
ncbi:hypothetical protein AOC36_02985 [Erysipelothrix larvae]|uniref:Uncharacterized protein n=1 Tax=Erysipelothrix larvae TaxID=1514105 RepID=A0A0X8GYY0_9FIRM|nr:LacI family DNA-binding transcriptional regulator [Erysipelothrix larvae]AMC92982.1 hypothetical protein AOC36_02985 [Erysipelothrix larvae]